MRRYIRTIFDINRFWNNHEADLVRRRAILSGETMTTVRDEMAFLQGFLRHPGQVGAVIPSSSFLEKRLVRAASVEEASCVVELGPGTGGTTRALLKAMRADSSLLAIELNSNFLARLASGIDDPRLLLQLGSAENLADFVAGRKLPAPEVILSGIPFSTLPPTVADQVARAVAGVLAPGGRFIAYQVRTRVTNYINPYLGRAKKEREMLNIPPVQIFVWTK